MAGYSPLEKVAIILISLGKEVASDILAHFDQKEVRSVAQTMNRIGVVDEKTVKDILEEFSKQLSESKSQTLKGEPDFTRAIVEKAFGSDRSQQILAGIGMELSSLQTAVDAIDDETLIEFLSEERPQIVAAVLTLCPAQRRVSLFLKLESAHRMDALMDIAKLSSLSIEAIEELDTTLRELSERSKLQKNLKVGGTRVAAQIMAQLDTSLADKLLKEMEGRDPELAEQIRKLMFRFEDLIRVENRFMQKFIPKIDRELLVKALKKAEPTITNHFLSNVSVRVAEDLKERIENLPPLRLQDIEAARNEIVELAKKLQSSGDIEIRSPQDIYV